MRWQTLASILAFILMIVGLFGIVLPFLPGIPLIWFAIFLTGVVTRFTTVDVTFVALTGVLTLLALGLEYWSSRLQVREFRVTPFGVFGGVLGGLVGAFFGIFPAVTIGPLLGSVIGEMLTGRDSVYVLETETYKIIGYIGSSLVTVTIGIMLIGLWLAKVF